MHKAPKPTYPTDVLYLLQYVLQKLNQREGADLESLESYKGKLGFRVSGFRFRRYCAGMIVCSGLAASRFEFWPYKQPSSLLATLEFQKQRNHKSILNANTVILRTTKPGTSDIQETIIHPMKPLKPCKALTRPYQISVLCNIGA